MPMAKQTVHKGQKKVTRTSQNEKQGWRTFGIGFFRIFQCIRVIIWTAFVT